MELVAVVVVVWAVLVIGVVGEWKGREVQDGRGKGHR